MRILYSFGIILNTFLSGFAHGDCLLDEKIRAWTTNNVWSSTIKLPENIDVIYKTHEVSGKSDQYILYLEYPYISINPGAIKFFSISCNKLSYNIYNPGDALYVHGRPVFKWMQLIFKPRNHLLKNIKVLPCLEKAIIDKLSLFSCNSFQKTGNYSYLEPYLYDYETAASFNRDKITLFKIKNNKWHYLHTIHNSKKIYLKNFNFNSLVDYLDNIIGSIIFDTQKNMQLIYHNAAFSQLSFYKQIYLSLKLKNKHINVSSLINSVNSIRDFRGCYIIVNKCTNNKYLLFTTLNETYLFSFINKEYVSYCVFDNKYMSYVLGITFPDYYKKIIIPQEFRDLEKKYKLAPISKKDFLYLIVETECIKKGKIAVLSNHKSKSIEKLLQSSNATHIYPFSFYDIFNNIYNGKHHEIVEILDYLMLSVDSDTL